MIAARRPAGLGVARRDDRCRGAGTGARPAATAAAAGAEPPLPEPEPEPPLPEPPLPEPAPVEELLCGCGVLVAVAVGDGDAVGVGVAAGGGGTAAQDGLLMTLVSRETWPLRASSRPWIVAPVCIVMEVRATTLPTNVVLVPMVAELPTCQKTLHGWAAPVRATVALLAEIRVVPAWKMNTAAGSPSASRVTVPVSPIEVEAL